MSINNYIVRSASFAFLFLLSYTPMTAAQYQYSAKKVRQNPQTSFIKKTKEYTKQIVVVLTGTLVVATAFMVVLGNLKKKSNDRNREEESDRVVTRNSDGRIEGANNNPGSLSNDDELEVKEEQKVTVVPITNTIDHDRNSEIDEKNLESLSLEYQLGGEGGELSNKNNDSVVDKKEEINNKIVIQNGKEEKENRVITTNTTDSDVGREIEEENNKVKNLGKDDDLREKELQKVTVDMINTINDGDSDNEKKDNEVKNKVDTQESKLEDDSNAQEVSPNNQDKLHGQISWDLTSPDAVDGIIDSYPKDQPLPLKVVKELVTFIVEKGEKEFDDQYKDRAKRVLKRVNPYALYSIYGIGDKSYGAYDDEGKTKGVGFLGVYFNEEAEKDRQLGKHRIKDIYNLLYDCYNQGVREDINEQLKLLFEKNQDIQQLPNLLDDFLNSKKEYTIEYESKKYTIKRNYADFITSSLLSGYAGIGREGKVAFPTSGKSKEYQQAFLGYFQDLFSKKLQEEVGEMFYLIQSFSDSFKKLKLLFIVNDHIISHIRNKEEADIVIKDLSSKHKNAQKNYENPIPGVLWSNRNAKRVYAYLVPAIQNLKFE